MFTPCLTLDKLSTVAANKILMQSIILDIESKFCRYGNTMPDKLGTAVQNNQLLTRCVPQFYGCPYESISLTLLEVETLKGIGEEGEEEDRKR